MAAVLSIASCSFWGDNAMVIFALRKSALSWTQVFGWMIFERKSALTKSQRWVFPLFFQVILKRVKLKVFPVFVWICRSGLFDHFVHLKKGCFDWSIFGSSFLLFAVSPSGYETKSFVHRVRLDWHEFISGGKVWNSTQTSIFALFAPWTSSWIRKMFSTLRFHRKNRGRLKSCDISIFLISMLRNTCAWK